MIDQTQQPNPIKTSLILLARMGFFAVALMWPAGTWQWWQAWVIVGIWSCFVVYMTIYLSRHDPALLAERMQFVPMQKDQKVWDKILMSLFLMAAIVLYIVPGFDVLRYEWSEPLPLWIEAIAMIIHIPCLVLLAWVMRENTYLSQVVKIDDARGQQVITTGPYALVRHPMYSILIVLLFAIPIALGSRFGLIPAAILTILLILRTHFEDRTLHRELADYPAYAKQTAYRLIPGIW